LLAGVPIGLLFKIFAHVFWIPGAALTVLLGYLALMKLKIIEKNDLVEVGKAIIPKKYQPTIYDLTKPIVDLICGKVNCRLFPQFRRHRYPYCHIFYLSLRNSSILSAKTPLASIIIGFS